MSRCILKRYTGAESCILCCSQVRCDSREVCSPSDDSDSSNPPQILRHMEPQSVEAGKPVRFSVAVSGLPKPEISWFHNRQPIHPTKNVVFHFDEVTNIAMLIIVDAFSEHAGQYTCTAVNNAGEAACSATLTITQEEEEGNLWLCRLQTDSTETTCFSSCKINSPFSSTCKGMS
uniref:Ig-like domain-containing protein n=1 Tax=Monopterus albus TaxID=43700 RepID=A0A3Q3JCF7_MONAL